MCGQQHCELTVADMPAIPPKTPDFCSRDIGLRRFRNLHVGISCKTTEVVPPNSLAVIVGEIGKSERHVDTRSECLIHYPYAICSEEDGPPVVF